MYCTCIKFRELNFCVFGWQKNVWGIIFLPTKKHEHFIVFFMYGGVVGTIVVKYARYYFCGVYIFVDKGIPRNPRKFIQHEI